MVLPFLVKAGATQGIQETLVHHGYVKNDKKTAHGFGPGFRCIQHHRGFSDLYCIHIIICAKGSETAS